MPSLSLGRDTFGLSEPVSDELVSSLRSPASLRGTVPGTAGAHTTREKDVVGTRRGDVQEGACGPAHTKAAAVANLVSSAAGVEVAADL